MDQIQFGSGLGTRRISILPAGSPTTAADGIGFGSDVVLYRSASGRLTLTGDLEVTGNLLASNVSIHATMSEILFSDSSMNESNGEKCGAAFFCSA